MTKASDNAFPSILITEGTEPSAPAAGKQRLYIDSTTHHLTRTNSSGTETDIESAGGGIPATIFDAQGDVIVASAADTAARLALGTAGQALVSNGTTAVWGRPKGTPVDFGYVLYTGGDITCDANTVWEDLGISDITLTAASGDIVEVAFSAWCNNSTAVQLHFDAVSIVSAAPVNSFATGTTPSDSNVGVAAWAIASSAAGKSAGSIMYTLQAGDITGGTVVIRMRDKPNGSTDRVVGATAVSPIHFTAKNLGPAI